MKNYKYSVLLIAIFLICQLVCVAGCANELKEGEIVNKEYEPEREFLYMMPIAHTMTTGKTTTTYFTYIPVYMRDDEDYKILVKGKNKDGETLTETFYINKNQYACVRVGDHFKVTDDCSKEPNPDVKVRDAH